MPCCDDSICDSDCDHGYLPEAGFLAAMALIAGVLVVGLYFVPGVSAIVHQAHAAGIVAMLGSVALAVLGFIEILLLCLLAFHLLRALRSRLQAPDQES